MVFSPTPALETRAEWVAVAIGITALLIFLVIDTVMGLGVFSRYWPVIGILSGLGFLGLHRLIAPDEW